MSDWLRPWQNNSHVAPFNHRSSLPYWILARELEAMADVRLLNCALSRANVTHTSVLELGCATGEMCRYLERKYRFLRYTGIDISEPAIKLARTRYPYNNFSTQIEGHKSRFDVIYSRDVLHHQPSPDKFLRHMFGFANHAVVFRCRTRDHGATVYDPQQSCQYQYDGFVPYIVSNTSELTELIRSIVPTATILMHQNYQILGGRNNRHLPHDCYKPETETAETSVLVMLEGSGLVGQKVADEFMRGPGDEQVRYRPHDYLYLGVRKLLRTLNRRIYTVKSKGK